MCFVGDAFQQYNDIDKYMQFTRLYLNVTYFYTFYNKKKINKENCTGVKDNGNTLFEQAIVFVSMYMETKNVA